MAIVPYADIFESANLEIILRILEAVAELGEGNIESAVYVSFLTRSDTLGLPPALKAKYPEDITIVFEHQFDNLTIDRDAKEIRVSVWFSGSPAHLRIPFGDITGLSDPNGVWDDGENRMDFPVIVKVVPADAPVVESPCVKSIDANVVSVNFGKKSS